LLTVGLKSVLYPNRAIDRGKGVGGCGCATEGKQFRRIPVLGKMDNDSRKLSIPVFLIELTLLFETFNNLKTGWTSIEIYRS